MANHRRSRNGPDRINKAFALGTVTLCRLKSLAAFLDESETSTVAQAIAVLEVVLTKGYGIAEKTPDGQFKSWIVAPILSAGRVYPGADYTAVQATKTE